MYAHPHRTAQERPAGLDFFRDPRSSLRFTDTQVLRQTPKDVLLSTYSRRRITARVVSCTYEGMSSYFWLWRPDA